ncbi:hypothetical protein HM1_1556 [Heliomicrobium modesticaldum Ice1]|uniref:Uncharacterized protein n=1 Tax=Heliobacterium modesticaldum (strain ATCC 51547 / Ice1) TaxID=498761 RepID=B0TD88_HELMI|nr:hypothetical protein HM1_1556 [Heliomicrobium modesticaldum Ice1]
MRRVGKSGHIESDLPQQMLCCTTTHTRYGIKELEQFFRHVHLRATA